METKLTGIANEVVIADNRPTVLIGERINPTGKKKLAEALRAGDLGFVQQEALDQVRAGADMIDVNVATFGVDEVTMLPQVVKAVMETVDVPLCIDSSNHEALAAAIKIYPGKPLINSVTGEESSLKTVLPLIKEHGAAVISLVQDEDGVPTSSNKRLAIARKIIKRAEEIGIPRQDIIIDCLALAVGADPKSGITTMETIRQIKNELGVNLTLGASNVSFGLPDRNLLTNTFAAVAIAAGITCLIVDVAKVHPTVLAVDLVLGRDSYARRYITGYRKRHTV
ncbi:dihydropteroate synthase [Chloroflexota bacterium]